jgi:hypothetical protein
MWNWRIWKRIRFCLRKRIINCIRSWYKKRGSFRGSFRAELREMRKKGQRKRTFFWKKKFKDWRWNTKVASILRLLNLEQIWSMERNSKRSKNFTWVKSSTFNQRSWPKLKKSKVCPKEGFLDWKRKFRILNRTSKMKKIPNQNWKTKSLRFWRRQWKTNKKWKSFKRPKKVKVLSCFRCRWMKL